MQDDATVRQFRLNDRDALLAFLSRVYAADPRRGDREFWDWHFLENPYTNSEDLPIWLAFSGGEIVGHLAAIETEIMIEERVVPAIWILDLIIDERFRRRGFAKKLVTCAESFRPICLGINTHEQHSPELLEARGWKIVASITRYTSVLFPANAFLSKGFVPEAGRKVLNAAFKIRRPSLESLAPRSGRTIRMLGSFGAETDALWRAASKTRKIAAIRDAKFLNWQYRDQPSKKFEIVGLFDRDDLAGYAVLYFRKPLANGVIEKAAISDIWFDETAGDDVVRDLINAAIRLAIEKRVGRLVTDIMDASAEKTLADCGFIKTKSPLLLMVRPSEEFKTILNSGDWYVTRGDPDTTIFEAANL